MAIRFPMSEEKLLNKVTPSQSQNQEHSKQSTSSRSQLVNDLPVVTSNVEIQAQQPNCNCSNIKVMQLFHEMKQEFPTIPDYVINQHVIDNCHNRENCKVQLQSEVDCQLVPLQAYPAQLISILNKNSMCKNRSQPKNLEHSNNTETIENSRYSPKSIYKLFLLDEAVSPTRTIAANSSEGAQHLAPDQKDMRSGLCNIQIKTYLVDQNKLANVLDSEAPQLPKPPQRPTTLSLHNEPYSKQQSFNPNTRKQEQSKHQNNERKSLRNWSSPLPSPSQSQGSATTTPSTLSSPKFSTGNSSTISIQSPSVYSDSRKTEISVNVSLSPSSYRQRAGPSQRHQSTIHVCPELPFARNFESTGNNQKSYTSVNLVLRQPTSSPQSPIDITVGPNLTYSSSSYDARLGYQNNYHITVTDDGGVFSAFRIHPVNYNNSTVENADRNVKECRNSSKAESETSSNSYDPVARNTHLSGHKEAYRIIMRQHNQMEKLSAVVQKNKNKLGLIQKEVKCVMQSDDIDPISERLDSEIEKLRCDCQAMLNEIEYLGTCGISEDSIEYTNSIKSRQQPFPKQKPIRFTSSTTSANCSRKQQQRLHPNALVSQRHKSITYHDDDPSESGVGD